MWDAFKAVFWSFFGVRKRAEYEADTQRVKPQHVIAAGLVSALVLDRDREVGDEVGWGPHKGVTT